MSDTMQRVLLGAALLGALVAPALAQEATTTVVEAVVETAAAPSPDVPAHAVWIFNTLLFLVSGFLVMFMAAGFAMLEAGLVRTKNVAMQCTKNIMIFGVAALGYYIIGYNLMYPAGAWTIGSAETGGYLGKFAVAALEAVGVAPDGVDNIEYASTGSDFFFQLMFCATTASIVSGTLAERIKLWPFMLFTTILVTLIYPIQASWDWGGGFLESQFGFKDFAGSTLVHSVGGWAALAGALVLGPRLGKYAADGSVRAMPGSNLPLATLGTFILWLGWFGFNGGSQLAFGSIGAAADVSRIFVNTNMAAAGGLISAAILTQLVYGKVDLTMILNGALAGLVSITAEPLTPSVGTAILVGAIGGAIVVFAVPLLDRLKIDDVVGAIPVHLVCGLWGTLAVAFTNPDATITGQLTGILSIAAFAFGVSLVIWLVLNAALGIRVSEEEEMSGLDAAELGMEAYPEFGKGSQFA
jgi:Amt family ammonium transporter